MLLTSVQSNLTRYRINAATDVALSVVCVSVCWAHGWTAQKRPKRSRCHLGADSCGSKHHVLDGVQIPHGKGHFWEGDMCRRIITYLCMSALRPPRANVPAQRTQRTNAFAAASGDNTRCGHWPNYFGHRTHRLHAVHKMQPTVTDVACSVACVSVCLWWSLTRMYQHNSWTDQDAVWGANSCGPKEPCCVLEGIEIPTARGNFWRFSRPLKSNGGICCGVCSKKIIQSLISARHAMQPFVKIPWPLVIIIIIIRRIAIAAYCCRRCRGWSVCLSVCLCVCWSRSWALRKRPNRSRCRSGSWLEWAQGTKY